VAAGGNVQRRKIHYLVVVLKNPIIRASERKEK
jgi:hypothetical protein